MARAFSAKIHTTLPDTKVYAIGLPYVLNASNDRETLATVKEMNRMLAELAKTEKNFGYIDLFSASVDDKGKSNIVIILADDLGYGDVQPLVICFLRQAPERANGSDQLRGNGGQPAGAGFAVGRRVPMAAGMTVW